MNILHFCSYYIGSKVYRCLFHNLSKNNVHSKVFIPIRSERHSGSNFILDDRIDLEYVRCLSFITRFFISFKILSVFFLSLLRERGSKNYDVVHAHTLYADGISAYIFSLVKQQKLVITVRNTDVNLGFKFFKHYKWLVKKALSYSDKIIFISPAHIIKFRYYFGEEFDCKIILIPNGIEEVYIENALDSKANKLRLGTVRGLYIGSIDKNKNIESTILAFEKACLGMDWTLNIVGGNYSEYTDIYGKLSPGLLNKVNFIERTEDFNLLLKFYDQSNVFVMPSFKETFGLVYLEAISRCIPVVYSSGQGIDGVFKEGEVGYSCDPYSIDSISTAIQSVFKSFPLGLGPYHSNPSQEFSWKKISLRYIREVYN